MNKVIHFMSVKSQVFNTELICLINDRLDGCVNHLFVTNDPRMYAELGSRYDNIKYVLNVTTQMINESADYDTIVMHSMCLTDGGILRLKESILAKIIWSVWGHDLYRKLRCNTVRSVVKSVCYGFWARLFARRKLRGIKAITAGYAGDVARIRALFGEELTVCDAPYAMGYYAQDIRRVQSENPRVVDDKVKIMIGHSGYEFLKHKKYIDTLSRYDLDRMEIHLVLSYGTPSYIDEVIKYAREMVPASSLRIVTEFMTRDEYIAYLCGIDAAVFDFDHQAAYGNIALLSFMGKKLYLSPSGVMSMGFRSCSAAVYDCGDLGRVSLTDIKSEVAGSPKESPLYVLFDKEQIVAKWRDLFKL